MWVFRVVRRSRPSAQSVGRLVDVAGYHRRMANGEPLSGAVKLGVAALRYAPRCWHEVRRCWYWLCPYCAKRRFRSPYLQTLVAGLLEQVEAGSVNSGARLELAVELEVLSVYPPAIRGRHAEEDMGREPVFLGASMAASDDALRLKMSRKVFRKNTLSDPDFLSESLGALWDKHFKGDQDQN